MTPITDMELLGTLPDAGTELRLHVGNITQLPPAIQAIVNAAAAVSTARFTRRPVPSS